MLVLSRKSVETNAAYIFVSGRAEVIDDLVEKGALKESEWLNEAKRKRAAEDEEMAKVPHLIRCGVHKMAPWVAVCVHILDRTASAVVPVPSERGGEVENDWFCTKCYEEFCGNRGLLPQPRRLVPSRKTHVARKSIATRFGVRP